MQKNKSMKQNYKLHVLQIAKILKFTILAWMFAMFLSTEVGSFPWGAVLHRGLEKPEAGVPGTD